MTLTQLVLWFLSICAKFLWVCLLSIPAMIFGGQKRLEKANSRILKLEIEFADFEYHYDKYFNSMKN